MKSVTISEFEKMQILGVNCLYDYLEMKKKEILCLLHAFNETCEHIKNGYLSLDDLYLYNKKKGLNIDFIINKIQDKYVSLNFKHYLLIMDIIMKENLEIPIDEICRFNKRMYKYLKATYTKEPGLTRTYLQTTDVIYMLKDELDLDILNYTYRKN